MSEELKPCPFCRRKAHVRRCTDEYGDPTCGYRCFCSGCTDGPWGETREEAIKLWNTRPSEDALRAELARKDEEIAVLKSVGLTLAEMAHHAGWACPNDGAFFDPEGACREKIDKGLCPQCFLDFGIKDARARLAELREGVTPCPK